MNNKTPFRERLANARVPVLAALALAGLVIAGLVAETRPTLFAVVLPAAFVGIVGLLFPAGSCKPRPDVAGMCLLGALILGGALAGLTSVCRPEQASLPVFAAVIGAAWLLSSVLYNARSESSLDLLYDAHEKLRSAREWLTKHPWLFSGPVFLYASLIGLVYEASLFAAVGLPIQMGTDPRNLLLAVFSHPLLVAGTIVGGSLVALALLLLMAALDVGEDGRTGRREADDGIGVRLLRLPIAAVRVLRDGVLYICIVLLVVLPFLLAVGAAEHALVRANQSAPGTLTDLASGRQADGVKLVGHTSSRLIAVVNACNADSDAPSSTRKPEHDEAATKDGKTATKDDVRAGWFERWWNVLGRMGAALRNLLFGGAPQPPDTLVLPASVPVSFHTASADSCYRGWRSDDASAAVAHHIYATVEVPPDAAKRDTQVTVQVPPEAINVAVDARIQADGVLALMPSVASDPAPPSSLPRVVVVEGEPTSTFAVLFPPLSPFTTGSAGATVPPGAARWLRHFREALAACDIDRVKVVGHASRTGFGAPRHQSVWSAVTSPDETRAMNCGLANLRALQVASGLGRDVEDADRKREELIEQLNKAKDMAECPGLGNEHESRSCRAQAELIRAKLGELCALPPESVTTPDVLAVEVHAWDNARQQWRWLPRARTSALNQSARIVLQGSDHAGSCPMLFEQGAVPSRTEPAAAS